MVKILEQANELLCERAGDMKRYIRPRGSSKPVMSTAQKRGYDMAIPYIKKYAKAMKVLGR